MDPILAGIVTSVPLMLVGAGYGWVKGKSFVAGLKAANPDKVYSNRRIVYLFLVLFVLPTFFLGVLSGGVYGFLGKPMQFLALEILLATIVSPWTARRDSPIVRWRIFFNYLSAVTFGVVIPLLVG